MKTDLSHKTQERYNILKKVREFAEKCTQIVDTKEYSLSQKEKMETMMHGDNPDDRRKFYGLMLSDNPLAKTPLGIEVVFENIEVKEQLIEKAEGNVVSLSPKRENIVTTTSTGEMKVTFQGEVILTEQETPETIEIAEIIRKKDEELTLENIENTKEDFINLDLDLELSQEDKPMTLESLLGLEPLTTGNDDKN